MCLLNLKKLVFRYLSPSSDRTLFNIDISVNKGECLVLMGKSGTGKSTLLKLIEGRLKPTSGLVLYEGGGKPKYKIATVLQDYSLFPHMTVLENILLPLRKEESVFSRFRTNKKAVKKANKILKMVYMSDFSHKYPHLLSGGQKQRVAIAQAIAQNADLLLMDEPFGALDTETRGELQKLLKKIQLNFSLAIILVTHDLEEALFLADSIYILKNINNTTSSTLSRYSIQGKKEAFSPINKTEAVAKELKLLKLALYN